jgi:hypothetical protein
MCKHQRLHQMPPETRPGNGMRKTFNDLPQRYGCLINPYVNERLSRCPVCRKLTHGRKFALFIHIEEFGGVLLGKTCRYCTPCELIMIHKELEEQLADKLPPPGPEAAERYLVVGTVDMKFWRGGLQGTSNVDQDLFQHLSVFKTRFDLQVTGRRWSLDSDLPEEPRLDQSET